MGTTRRTRPSHRLDRPVALAARAYCCRMQEARVPAPRLALVVLALLPPHLHLQLAAQDTEALVILILMLILQLPAVATATAFALLVRGLSPTWRLLA